MNRLEVAQAACTACALLLALLWGLWYGLIAPAGSHGLVVLLIGALPLVLLAPGAFFGSRLATAMLGFLSLFYLAHGLTELIANPDARWLASGSTLLSLLLFLAASHRLRLGGGTGR